MGCGSSAAKGADGGNNSAPGKVKAKQSGSKLGTTEGAIRKSPGGKAKGSTEADPATAAAATAKKASTHTKSPPSTGASNKGGSFSSTHKQRPNFNITMPNPFDSGYVIVRSSTNLSKSCPYESINIAKDRRSRTVVFVGVVNMGTLQQLNLEIEFFKHLDIYRQLDCPGIAKIVDVFDVQNMSSFYYIVYEFIQGKELSFMLENAGVLPVGMARVVLRKLLVIIEYLHSHNIIHANLKTESVRCTEWPWYPATSNKEVYITGFSKCVRTNSLPASTAFSDAMLESMPEGNGSRSTVNGKSDEAQPPLPTSDDSSPSAASSSNSSSMRKKAVGVDGKTASVKATEERLAASEQEFVKRGGIVSSGNVYTSPEVSLYLQQLYLAKKHVRSSILSHSLSPSRMFGNIVPYVDENQKLSNPYSEKIRGGGGDDFDPKSPRNTTGSPLNAETIAANAAGRMTEYNTAANVAIRRASAAFFTNSPPAPSGPGGMPAPPGYAPNSVVPVLSPVQGDEGAVGGKGFSKAPQKPQEPTAPILTAAVDIYALGVIYAECILGKMESRDELIRSVEQAAKDGKVPASDKDMIMRMISVHPWSRPTAQEVTKMLQVNNVATSGSGASTGKGGAGGGKKK